MNIVYIHGLDSDANSTKGLLLERYCQDNFPNIKVHRPDLNQSPQQVFSCLTDLVTQLSNDTKTVLVGSSLGGYFSTLVGNRTGMPALLLNPSTQPHMTLQRFMTDSAPKDDTPEEDWGNQIIHSTAGGWDMTQADLQWFAAHQLLDVKYPDRVAVVIKDGDELLNATISADFYREQGAAVTLQQGGDHRFSDFSEQLPMIIQLLQQL